MGGLFDSGRTSFAAADQFGVEIETGRGRAGTGPMMPDAVYYVAFILFAVAAPLAAWFARSRSNRPRIGLAFAPIVIGALTLLLEPLFV